MQLCKVLIIGQWCETCRNNKRARVLNMHCMCFYIARTFWRNGCSLWGHAEPAASILILLVYSIGMIPAPQAAQEHLICRKFPNFERECCLLRILAHGCTLTDDRAGWILVMKALVYCHVLFWLSLPFFSGHAGTRASKPCQAPFSQRWLL